MSVAGEELLGVCRSLKETLGMLKNRIGRCSQADWDTYKMLRNPYERVYLAQPCVPALEEEKRCGNAAKKHPVSRAFYKLWEVCMDDPVIWALMRDPGGKRFAYAAEGPGSFVEAVVTMRANNGMREDRHTGMTLVSEKRCVPQWKLSANWMREHHVSLCRGVDGTGNIYKTANVQAFVRACGGAGSCDMVTGDGGFDFSSNFNEQESQMTRLIAGECLIALRVLKRGGVAVIKVFDAFCDCTLEILHAFAERFERYRLVKPLTSRPANSERYMVCTGFKGCESEDVRQFVQLTLEPREGGGRAAQPRAQEWLAMKNIEHAATQIESIVSTLDAMERKDNSAPDDRSEEWLAEHGL